jgi:hypothetical protein
MPAAPTCAGCAAEITSGAVIQFGDRKYHDGCFRCSGCSAALADAVQSKGVHANGGRPYCGGCWTSRFAERCAACTQPFVGRERVVVFEGAKLHPRCFKCAGPCGACLGEALKYVKHADKPYCSACHSNAFGPKCSACQAPLGTDPYVSHKGRKLHKHCFCCTTCGRSLAGIEHYDKGGELLCADDYRLRHGHTCAICSAKLLQWISCPTTGDVYCPHHEKDCHPCHGCGRLVPSRGPSRGLDYSDGRVACAACESSAVHTLEEATLWFGRVSAFFARLGVPPLPSATNVQLRLVDRSQLLATTCGHVCSAHHGHTCPVGLTCAEQLTTITSIGGRTTSVDRQTAISSVTWHDLA